ncbi:iron complex outermembrane receptor protein [Mucilaginibacter gracilis]|uniref:Iron complex outermembrane receptor protein n=1 Tax=Mucilaginibacter gracilis TaxID=423350 RepID=A0A495IW60_9SPHI|nr:TonB-dependent receptor [Mucilaginibacter gracilis]RKR80822.1 iron complex outermembrane receptor protein [Mucilaginibacter gracilis]
MKKLLLAISGLVLPFLAAAQFSVSGKITDAQTGETLPGATITIQNQSQAADSQGIYIIKSLKKGVYTVKVKYVGYEVEQTLIEVAANVTKDFYLSKSTTLAGEVNVNATRASKTAATTFTNLSKKDLEKNNLGQDLPFLLNQTPSAVVTSDAGTGVGYTGIHIRGTDATRTNLTLNGIPLNDAEDQGAYFVDLPDLASSVDNIQIQRGVGTSTNGAGAFGASINMQTNVRRDTGYAELNNSFGSYGTLKNTVSLGSGLVGNHFQFDGRLSRIKSDGYIDRASSDLKSYFLSGAYYGKNTTVQANVFSGYEKTYQAWDGVPEALMGTHRTYNELGLKPNGTFYNNQTDNYTQNYAQVLVGQKISDVLSFNGALHYTKGYGYYEEYKRDQDLTSYGIKPIVAGSTTDLVRRLWLDNDFYGLTYAFDFHPDQDFKGILGGAYNEYKGRHYDNIEWTQQGANVPPDYEYSRNNAKKTDFNIFGKAEQTVGDFKFSVDLQYRHINYSFLGFDRNLNNVQQDVQLDFFNPKAGITYLFSDNSNVYASIAVANHEPNRSDFVNSTPDSRPKSENLKDLEIGYRTKGDNYSFGANGFYMLYKNQLVLTGQLNDVGEAIRSNVDKSYRAGIELEGRVKITSWLNWAGNAAFSANKVQNFNQYLINYYDVSDYTKYKITGKQYGTTDLAYSPGVVAYSEFGFVPVKGGEVALISKFVGKQYLDNTSNINPDGYPTATVNGYPSNRYLDSYFVSNLRLRYNFSTKSIKNIGLTLLVNNVFNKLYSANGATYPDIEGGSVYNYNYYYPQATRNFLASLSLVF